jgi:hypothetical protein
LSSIFEFLVAIAISLSIINTFQVFAPFTWYKTSLLPESVTVKFGVLCYQIHIQPHVADAPIHRPSSNPAQILASEHPPMYFDDFR